MSTKLFDELELFLFDMDGLLFDTESIYIDYGKNLAREMGYEISDELIEKTTGVTNKLSKELFLKELGNDFKYDEFTINIVNYVIEQANLGNIPLMKGAKEILQFLKENNKKIALGTSADLKMAQKLLKSKDLEKYFECLVTSDDVKIGKPNPEVFLKGAKNLNVLPNKTMVFEDSFNGIRAAHSAGMYPVMIPDKLYPTQEIEKIIFKKFDSLLDVIEFFKNENNIV